MNCVETLLRSSSLSVPLRQFFKYCQGRVCMLALQAIISPLVNCSSFYLWDFILKSRHCSMSDYANNIKLSFNPSVSGSASRTFYCLIVPFSPPQLWFEKTHKFQMIVRSLTMFFHQFWLLDCWRCMCWCLQTRIASSLTSWVLHYLTQMRYQESAPVSRVIM